MPIEKFDSVGRELLSKL